MKKKCTKCGVEKMYDEFYKDKRTKNGCYAACKKCVYVIYPKKYSTQYLREWREKNREKLREYNRNYDANRRKNPHIRVTRSVSHLMWMALKGKKEGRKWENILGYTSKDLVIHLEKQFDASMTWENYGSYWSLDHIRPRSSFSYQTTEDPGFKECWALENLQPLEQIANKSKGNKLLFHPLRETP